MSGLTRERQAEQSNSSELDRAVESERRRGRRSKVFRLTLSFGTPIFLLAWWEASARLGWIDGRLFSPPSTIFTTGGVLLANGELWEDILPSIGRLAAGFALAAVVGVGVGLLMGVWAPLRAALGPMFTMLYAVPKVAILPLFLLIFGINETPRVFVVFVAVFFVVQINTLSGILEIDRRVLEAARAYRARGLRLFWYILLPGALPSIFTGLRVAAGMAIVVVVAVEFVAANSGLGYFIWNSWQLFQPANMYVGLITVSIIGALTTALIVVIERLVLPWKSTSTTSKRRNHS